MKHQFLPPFSKDRTAARSTHLSDFQKVLPAGWFGWVAALLLAGLVFIFANPVAALQPDARKAPQLTETKLTTNPIPTLAYYYIWFDSTSWKRAKTDYPQLGRYSSDDRGVMRQHIQWAKTAGITGFIVSWKSTNVLNRRLEQLITLAEEEDFKLVIIYQGLDFDRNPLPVDRIDSDLSYFTEHYAGRKPFALFARPLVIWSGTWEFTPEEIAQVAEKHRGDMLLLASERNLAGYKRLASMVDGNAYYWSSVNPETFPGYKAKLLAMADAVHAGGGLWIPPAAPGFDARLLEGTTVVERKDGDTFRLQISTALASSPDALGIISWNEFSENSQIEPSLAFGSRYLEVLSETTLLPAPNIGEIDSSEALVVAQGPAPEVGLLQQILSPRVFALGVVTSLAIASLVIIAKRKSA